MYQSSKPVSERLHNELRPPHHFLPIRSGLRTLRDQIELPWRLRQARVELYHSPYYGMAIAPGVPYVVALHDIIPVLYPEYWSPFTARLIRRWQQQAVAHAACVITGAEAAAADVERVYGIPRSRIAVTPWGVVERKVSASEPRDVPQEPFVLCVCTNKPHKNLVRLIQAYERASMRQSYFPDLVIAGGWSDRFPEAGAELCATNARVASGAVRLVRNPSDAELRFLYEHALGFVFPSLYEGFGLPVLEAMQAGLPVAASTTPAVAEVTADAALLFDPLDVDAMATAIHRLVTEPDLRERLHTLGSSRLLAFDWSLTAQRTLVAYDIALRRTRGSS
jgi:glycosyltransferase involved in cell wall biosynthesis